MEWLERLSQLSIALMLVSLLGHFKAMKNDIGLL